MDFLGLPGRAAPFCLLLKWIYDIINLLIMRYPMDQGLALRAAALCEAFWYETSVFCEKVSLSQKFFHT